MDGFVTDDISTFTGQIARQPGIDVRSEESLVRPLQLSEIA
jgi:hypothetical protein